MLFVLGVSGVSSGKMMLTVMAFVALSAIILTFNALITFRGTWFLVVLGVFLHVFPCDVITCGVLLVAVEQTVIAFVALWAILTVFAMIKFMITFRGTWCLVAVLHVGVLDEGGRLDVGFGG